MSEFKKDLGIILAMDTSSKLCSMCITCERGVRSETRVLSERPHSENLFPAIDDTLKRAKLTYSDIDAYAVCTGPGNFTGLRVSVSAARGLAFASNKPIVGISAFEAIAPRSGLSAVILDGKQNTVYIQKFSDGQKSGNPLTLESETVKNQVWLSNYALIGYQASNFSKSLAAKFLSESTYVCPVKIAELSRNKASKSISRPYPIYLKPGVNRVH